MNIDELKQIEEAPKQGQMLAYTRQKVYFQPYHDLSEITELLKDKELLEIHLFNNQKEYRSLSSHKGPIEHLADFSTEDASTIYKEKMFLDIKGYQNKRLTVYNHIHYDDSGSTDQPHNGMLIIDDYRLSMGE